MASTRHERLPIAHHVGCSISDVSRQHENMRSVRNLPTEARIEAGPNGEKADLEGSPRPFADLETKQEEKTTREIRANFEGKSASNWQCARQRRTAAGQLQGTPANSPAI